MLDTFKIGAGTVLADRYEVIRRLGAGGMATVYLAEDNVLCRKVAVKRLHGERDEAADLERFRREARLGATLSHPNLVTVFDTVAGEDGVLIVMEYVHGETLASALANGPIPMDRALEMLSAVASALDHAHANGIVHRDVKPANVLIGEDGTVKLADLGIATAIESTRITMTNDVVGTLAYIAPERLDSDSAGGPEADVYGLAVLAYEALSGNRLSRGSTPAEVVHRAANEPAPDLREAWPDAPPRVARVLSAGMDRDPAKRPGSAGALVEQLRTAIDDGPEPAAAVADLDPTERMTRPEPTSDFAPPPPPERTEPPPAEPPPAERPAPSRSGRPRLALIAMALVGIAGLAALVFAIAGAGEDEPANDRRASVQNEGNGNNGAGGEQAEAPAAEEPAAAEEDVATTDDAPTASGDDPDALNDEGYALIQEGDYEGAVTVLQRAVDSYPEGSQDLTYAYALFNLGNALRLAGRPEEAIPVLEERLQIPDQTETVQAELDRARQEAGE